jgi:dimethylamine/trimethylamine dehydrogenase
MHGYTDETDALTRAVVAYARGRITNDQPLDRPASPAELTRRAGDWEAAGLASVRAVGDALCPGTIAAAVWDGRRYAEQLGELPDADGVPFLREIAGLSPGG